MFQSFMLKQLLRSKLKALPEADRAKVISIIEKKPELFVQIAKEIQEKLKTGMSEMDASMAVMKSHETEIRELLAR